jgi:hypothetical protein
MISLCIGTYKTMQTVVLFADLIATVFPNTQEIFIIFTVKLYTRIPIDHTDERDV